MRGTATSLSSEGKFEDAEGSLLLAAPVMELQTIFRNEDVTLKMLSASMV